MYVQASQFSGDIRTRDGLRLASLSSCSKNNIMICIITLTDGKMEKDKMWREESQTELKDRWGTVKFAIRLTSNWKPSSGPSRRPPTETIFRLRTETDFSYSLSSMTPRSLNVKRWRSGIPHQPKHISVAKWQSLIGPKKCQVVNPWRRSRVAAPHMWYAFDPPCHDHMVNNDGDSL